jgi:hypothetical protein
MINNIKARRFDKAPGFFGFVFEWSTWTLRDKNAASSNIRDHRGVFSTQLEEY